MCSVCAIQLHLAFIHLICSQNHTRDTYQQHHHHIRLLSSCQNTTKYIRLKCTLVTVTIIRIGAQSSLGGARHFCPKMYV